ncbi:MAG: OmpH family outer membrane protein [Syntrophobacteraceae bacterium]
MKRFSRFLLVALGVSLVFSSHAFALGQKIGFLNVSNVITQTHWGQQISSTLKTDEQNLTNSVQTKKNAFIAARDSYMKERSIMDAKARGRKEQQLSQMAGQLQQLMQDSQSKFAQEKKQALGPLLKAMYDAADSVAKSEGYDIIVDRSALIVTSPKVDITAKVISKIDSMHH